MGNQFNKAIIILIIVFIAGCKPNEIIISKTDTIFKEIRITEKLRDTVIFTEADSSILELLYQCDSMGNLLILENRQLKNGKPKIKYIIDKKYIRIFAKIDKEAVKLIVKDKLTKEVQKYSRVEKVAQTPKKPTFFAKLIDVLGWILFAAIIFSFALLMLLIFKPKINLLNRK